jgi:RNA polymerase sigma-70 factor, ECF subfamily
MSTCHELLRRCDVAAWDAFYREHIGELYGFVFRLVRGDNAAAADVFQDIWLDAVGHIEQFDPDRGELRAWLFGIARRRIALYWRRRTAPGGTAAIEPLDQNLESADGAILPEDVVEQLEQAAVVRAALLAMPPERRQAMTDKYVEGLSVAEIAIRSGKSPKAIESLLSRARGELRSLLSPYFDAEGVNKP